MYRMKKKILVSGWIAKYLADLIYPENVLFHSKLAECSCFITTYIFTFLQQSYRVMKILFKKFEVQAASIALQQLISAIII